MADEISFGGTKFLTSLVDRIDNELSMMNNRRVYTLSDLYIITKGRELIPLTPENLNEVQQRYLQEIGYVEGETFQGLKEITLKARQQGLSTINAALLFLDTINNNNTVTVVMAHEEKTAERLLVMCNKFYEMLPLEGKPSIGYDSKKQMSWPTINSEIHIGTAGSTQSFRGWTINNVLGSEPAFWSSSIEILAGLMEAVPLDGNVILESTANGGGDFFHEQYEGAKAGETGLQAHFYPWYLEKGYTIVGTTWQDLGTLNRDEEHLVTLGCDAGQLKWRRQKIASKGSDGLNIFKQEYPSTDIEAFRSAEYGVFNVEALDELAGLVTSPLYCNQDLPRQVSVIRELDTIDVWYNKKPEPNKSYIIVADPAEGLKRDEKAKLDSSAIVVCDRHSWEIVLRVNTKKLDPEQHGKALAELGVFFNDAEIAVERNNHGHAVLQSLRIIHSYPTKLIYRYKDYDKQHSRKARDIKAAAEFGFPTNVKTKKLGIDAAKAVLFDRTLRCADGMIVNQLKWFRNLPGGNQGAAPGKHDDLVTVIGILCYILTYEKPKTPLNQNQLPPKPNMVRRNVGRRI